MSSIRSVPTPRSDDPRAWKKRQALGLALVDGLLAVIVAAYALIPPVPGTPRELDALLVGVLVGMAVLALGAVPRRGPWALDVLLAGSWIIVALVTVSRPTAAGQVAFGTLLLVVALYAAYFTAGMRFALHLFGMTALYLMARLVDPLTRTTYFGVFTIGTVLAVAIVIHHLKGTDRRYQLLIENSADIIVQSRKGVLEWISPSVERVLGWTPQEMIGQPTSPLWHPDDVALATELRDRAYGGETADGLLRIRHHDGHYVWLEVHIKPLPSRGARGSVASWRDVTSRVVAEQAARRWDRFQREDAMRKARDAEARTQLFQNISHELRTPLAIVNGPLHDLQRHPDLTSGERVGLEAAVRASARMERLVDGLLDISRGHAEQLHSVTEPTDLAALTRGGTQMFAEMASRLGLRLESRISGVPARVLIDPETWMTVLVNLLSNAIKYTPSGSIQVELDYEDGTAHLSVTDTGVGIDGADLAHVFERYERAPSKPQHGEAGSGIGLAVVAQLLRASDGRSDIRSTVGGGTSVEIWMPAPPCAIDAVADSAHHLDVAAQQHAWAWASPSHAPVETSDQVAAHRGRILVVEDNDDLRGYVTRLLGDAGWDVTAVGDAESAEPLVGAHDLLLTDIMLPQASGIDLVRKVRAGRDDARWMPIVLLTARADGDTIVEGLAAGADDYVTKPFSPTELLARIATHVELSFLRQIVLDQANGRADNLERALGSNRTIGTALGIIMATERVSADEAFSRLRTASQHANRKLRDVADDVIFSGAVP